AKGKPAPVRGHAGRPVYRLGLSAMRKARFAIASPCRARFRVAAALVIAMSSAAALAQRPLTPPEPVAPPSQAVPPQATPPNKPGFFEAVGRWFDQGADNFRKLNEKAQENNKALNESAAEARRNAANATKDAIDSVSRLPTTRVVKGNERCEI